MAYHMMGTGLVLGAFVGIVLGLTGAGGGILAIPALTLAMGLSMSEARPVALIAVGLAASLGCMDALRKGIVRYRAAMCIAVAGMLFAPIGSQFSRWLPAQCVTYGFAALMGYLSLRALLQALHAERGGLASATLYPCELNSATGRLRWTTKCAARLGAIGVLTGLFTGLFGVGGGFVVTPGLNRVTNIGTHASAATSLMVISLVSTVSAAGMLITSDHVVPSGWWFVSSAAAGTLIGRWLAPNIPSRVLTLGFAILAMAAAILFMVRSGSLR